MTLDTVQRYVVGVLKGWFTNKAVVDKLEEDSEGMLLFNGQKIDSKKEVYIGTSAPKDPAVSIWLDTSTQPATLKRRTSLDTFDIVASMSVDTLGIANIEYSEEEKVVGCWIDGKPIYRKVLTIENAISQNSWGIANSGFNDIDRIIHSYGFSNSDPSTHPHFTVSPYTSCKDGNIYVYCINAAMQVGENLIIEYTKTTDEPGSFDPNMLDTTALESLATDDEVNAVTWSE